jgi:hypothetical protein
MVYKWFDVYLVAFFCLATVLDTFLNLGIFFISSGHTEKRPNKLERLSMAGLYSLV